MLKTKFNDDGFLVVDTSYLVHCICFRALNIYSNYCDVPPDPKELYKIDFSQDEDFIDIFTKNFRSVVKKLCKKYCLKESSTIFAIDCSKKNIWRLSFYSEYKLPRMVRVAEGLNRGPIFQYVKEKLLPDMIMENKGFSIKHRFAEGDDVIGVSKRYLRNLFPEKQIVILASDHDLLQCVDEHTTIITTQNKIVNESSKGSPKDDLLLKILIGDGADNIPKVFEKTKGDPILSRGFGEKAAMKLLKDRQLLLEYFKKYPYTKKQFKTNTKIISFDYIPKDIVEDIEKQLMEYI